MRKLLIVIPVLLGLGVFFGGFWMWQRLPGRHFFLSFLVWEIVVVLWIGVRLWQRAAEMMWYRRHRVVEAAPSVFAVVAMAPAPEAAPDASGSAPATE